MNYRQLQNLYLLLELDITILSSSISLSGRPRVTGKVSLVIILLPHWLTWSHQAETKSLTDNLNSASSSLTAISAYNSIIDSLVQFLCISCPSQTPRDNHSSWFDSDCWSLKKQIRTLFQLIRQQPTPSLLKLYFHLCRASRALFDEKRHLFAQQKWSQLHQAILSHDQKAFWSLVSRANSPSFKPSYPISSVTWTDYFTKIFSITSSCSSSVNISQDLPEWPPVTPEEILELIISLESGKAPGPDLIFNETLTINPH